MLTAPDPSDALGLVARIGRRTAAADVGMVDARRVFLRPTSSWSRPSPPTPGAGLCASVGLAGVSSGSGLSSLET
ncbi:hypothetical protein [Parafrankia sp. EUN1f]|uniref:hypothetical protein n=1 Tax=Parafrankia sp. EUN1f TaxID=102897 RepID=UPI0002E6645A|nr:hypothetical protein [Parafrankia sp. EUN1f]